MAWLLVAVDDVLVHARPHEDHVAKLLQGNGMLRHDSVIDLENKLLKFFGLAKLGDGVDRKLGILNNLAVTSVRKSLVNSR